MKKIPICFDNGGESFDRYTLIEGETTSGCQGPTLWYIGSSENPCHPQGFWQHGELPLVNCRNIRGRFDLSHLGKRVPFDSLPAAVQDQYRNEYNTYTKPAAVAGVYEIGQDGYCFVYNVRPHTGRLVKYTALWISSAPYPAFDDGKPNRGEYVGRSARVRGRKTGWRNLPPYIVSRFYEQAGYPVQKPWQ